MFTEQQDTRAYGAVRRNASSESDIAQDSRRRRPNMDSAVLF